MPHLTVVERDYVNLVHRFNSLGPGIKEHGVEDHGIDMDVADLYDEFAKTVPSYECNGRTLSLFSGRRERGERRPLLCARVQRGGCLSRIQGTRTSSRIAAGSIWRRAIVASAMTSPTLANSLAAF